MPISPQVAQVLELARWAPSGDNTQCWRFGVLDDRHLIVYGHDTRRDCLYDFEGHPSQLSVGALLETMAIAASTLGWATTVTHRPDSPDEHPVFDVRFDPDAGVPPSPLAAHIRARSVQRRPFATRMLSAAEKQALEASVGPDYRVRWLEGLGNRWRVASLLFRNAKLRLTTPEAYEVHKRIIEWNARTSEDRVPDQALGVDAMTLRLMRFVMQSWPRVQFFNRFLAGTVAPRIQMDWLPGLACAAHYTIHALHAPVTIDDRVAAGRAVQRFWLTATRLGLVMQPEMTPLIFSAYARTRTKFTASPKLAEAARHIEQQTRALMGDDYATAVWMARIGEGPAATARSTRLPLSKLLVTAERR